MLQCRAGDSHVPAFFYWCTSLRVTPETSCFAGGVNARRFASNTTEADDPATADNRHGPYLPDSGGNAVNDATGPCQPLDAVLERNELAEA